MGNIQSNHIPYCHTRNGQTNRIYCKDRKCKNLKCGFREEHEIVHPTGIKIK